MNSYKIGGFSVDEMSSFHTTQEADTFFASEEDASYLEYHRIKPYP